MPAPFDIELRSINPKSTKFGPHRKRPPGKGRKLGQPNLFTKDLRNAILQAAHNVGDDNGRQGLVAYLEDAARYHKKAFCGLLAKSLPFNIVDAPGMGALVSINVVTIPPGFNSDGSPQSSPIIEHTPQPPMSADDSRRTELSRLPRAELRRLAGVSDEDDS